MTNELAKLDLDHKQASAIVLLDTQLTLIDHNRSWLRYIDTSADSVVGKNLYELLPTSQEVIRPIVEQVLEGESRSEKNLGLTVRDNTVYWDMSLEPQRDAGGNVTAVLMIAYAITEETLLRQLLQQRVDDRTRKLEALYAVANAANNVRDLAVTLQTCLEHVMKATDAAAAMIHLVDGEMMSMAAHIGLRQELQDGLQSISADAGLIGWVVQNRQPLVVSDMQLDPRTPSSLRESEMVAYAAIPMQPKKLVLGVLSIFRNKQHRITNVDMELLTSIADQVGSLIQLYDLQQQNTRLKVQEERTRIAHQLHDAVTQSLYSLTLFAGAVQQYADNGELEKGLPYIGRIQNTAQQALKEMRLLLHNLRPMALENEGLVEALRQRMNAVERRANVQGQVITKSEIDLPNLIEEALYYIASEALNNALKHANAERVVVILKQSNHAVTMTINDNGDGFDLEEARDSGGMGLASIRDRTNKMDGTLTIESSPNQGTTIVVTLPLNTA